MKINQFYNGDEHEILTTPSQPFREDYFERNDSDESVVESWETLLRKAANAHKETCAGLSLNQIWGSVDIPPLAMFLIKDGDDWKIFVNPEIKGSGKKIKDYEGCLSRIDKVPKLVKRDKNVTITYFDVSGEEHVEKYTMRQARVIQHEYDHLLGRVV